MVDRAGANPACVRAANLDEWREYRIGPLVRTRFELGRYWRCMGELSCRTQRVDIGALDVSVCISITYTPWTTVQTWQNTSGTFFGRSIGIRPLPFGVATSVEHHTVGVEHVAGYRLEVQH